MANRASLRSVISVRGTALIALGLIAFGTLALFGFSIYGLAVLISICSIAMIYSVRSTIINYHGIVHAEDVKHTVVNLAALQAIRNRFKLDIPLVSNASMTAENLAILLDILDEIKPERVVELGCGTSTLLIAAWMKEQNQGRLLSFDHLADWTAYCQRQLERFRLADRAELRVVPMRSTQSLGVSVDFYEIGATESNPTDIDLLVVDGPPAIYKPMARYPAMGAFYRRLARTAVVLLDDGNRPNEARTALAWRDEFKDFSATHFATLTGMWVLRRHCVGV